MKTRNRWILSVPILLLVSTPGLPQTADASRSEARDELARGVKALRESNPRQAIELFSRALEIDPAFRVAEFHLASTYASMATSVGGETAEGQEFGKKSVETFERIVRREPGNAEALSGLANMYSARKDFTKARETYLSLTKMATQDAKPFYGLAS